MRVVIDMQGAQAEHRFEATGRATLALARAIVRQRGPHDIVLALNGLFPDTIEPIRALFDDILSQEKIRIWHTPASVAAQVPANDARRALAEDVRERFFASLEADVVLVMSMFEGYASDALTSVGAFSGGPPVAVLVHDVGPLNQAMRMHEPGLAGHFRAKAARLADAACVLAMDAAVAADASALLGRHVLDLSTGLRDPLAPAGWDHLAQHAVAALDALVTTAAPAGSSASSAALLEQIIARVPFALDPDTQPDDLALRRWARALSRFPQGVAPRQLFVDISELARRDARTGVQRVTRSILKELLDNPPAGFHVVPVFAADDALGYRYARTFTAAFLGESAAGADAPIDYQSGDVFLGLDLVPHLVPRHQPFLKSLRDDGVRVYFVVYDLLPVLMPQFFPAGTEAGHRTWLMAISAFDGAICISRAVAQELRTWQQAHAAPRLRPFEISWFHLGADVKCSVPSLGLPDDATAVLAAIGRCPSLLAVGTIEPRKQYSELLSAFELLWARGVDANVVMVGKQGWMVDELVLRLRSHPESGKRLFWLEGISDEYLEKVYAACTCLVAPSVGEGFGLPLIEAAQHLLPILARDLPVFREVGGERAVYFSGSAPHDLATAIGDWLALHATATAPSSAGLAWLSWADSARQMMKIVLGQDGRASQLLAPATPASRRPQVLTLAPYPVLRPRHGGQLRTAALIRVYEAAGFDVHPVGFYQAEAYEVADVGTFDIAFPADSPFRQYLGMPVAPLSDFLMGPFSVATDQVFRQIAAALPGPVDVIQVEQPWMYALACRLRLESPLCRDALLVNSSQNIEAPMKRAILAPHISPALIDLAVTDMGAIEREATREAALSLAVTVEDAEALRAYGAPSVLHAANGISPWEASPERCAYWRGRLPQQPWPIFIASAHPPNYTGFLDAIGDTLACIPAGSKLVIAGGVGPHLERELAKSACSELNLSRLQILGVLDDADLAAVKSLAHAFLLPIGGGGGSNIKTAEALYSGRPVVCTRTALRGFERFAALPEVTIADTPAQFQDAIRKVLEAPAAVSEAGAAMRASLTWDVCLAAVPREVASLLAHHQEET